MVPARCATTAERSPPCAWAAPSGEPVVVAGRGPGHHVGVAGAQRCGHLVERQVREAAVVDQVLHVALTAAVMGVQESVGAAVELEWGDAEPFAQLRVEGG